MKSVTVIPVIVILCLLTSCGSPPKKQSNEEARIEREVTRRVDTIRIEMEHSQKRWHTTRVVVFCLLAGGTLIWLFHVADSPRPNENPNRNLPPNSPADSRRRFIEPTQDDEHDTYQNRD